MTSDPSAYTPEEWARMRSGGALAPPKTPLCINHRARYCDGIDVTYEPDPYQQEIHHDSTPVWECYRCRNLSADDA